MTTQDKVSPNPAVDSAAPGDDALISIRGVYKIFGDHEEEALQLAHEGLSKDEIQEQTGCVLGLRNVSFDVGKGEIFVVMGLSGCGKSTLVRCVNRLIEPSDGKIWMNGHEMTALSEEELRELRRTELSMVFQHFGLMPHRSVLDNAAWGLEIKGSDRQDRRERAEQALELVGLGGWGGAMPAELSGGMKQRVGLARALAMDAPVLLMDEPFSALDPVIRRDLQDELKQLQESLHKTIIFITHDLAEAVRVGDQLVIMEAGAVVQRGDPTHVALHPANSFVRDFTKDLRMQGLVAARSVLDETAVVCKASDLASEAAAGYVRPDREVPVPPGEEIVRIVDDAGRYQGWVWLADLERAPAGAPAGSVRIHADRAVKPDAVLDDMVALGIRADHPLPVVDDEQRFLGVVPLEVLADAMAEDHEEEDESAGVR